MMIMDDFLPEDEFNEIKNILWGIDFPWFYVPEISLPGVQIDNTSYMSHLFYEEVPYSQLFHKVYNIFRSKMEINSLIRIKANMHLHSNKFTEHPMHVDYDFTHKGALFSLNTCDGYTKLNDGTKIQSVANRMLFFDASEEHCSTNTSDKDRRVNINFNYF